MSYILDALNKAERERGLKHAPVPLNRHDLPAGSGNRRWILAIAIVACAVAATWFFLTYQAKDSQTAGSGRAGAEQESAAIQTETSREGGAVPPNAASSSLPSPELPVRTRAGLSNDTPLSPGLMAKVPAATASAPGGAGTRPAGSTEASTGAGRRLGQGTQAEALLQQDQAEPEELPPSEDATPQAQPDTTEDGQGTKVVTAAPASVQSKTLPLKEAVDKMTISVLMYSESKAERRVYINGRKYVEGDYVEGRYLVESITLEGVVLTYEGERALLRSGSR